KKNNCDIIIGAGGGSSIDIAKCINVFQSNESNFEAIIKNPSLIKNKGVPLIAIPTTAGTGSEATHFAVMYQNKIKYSIAHPNLMPEYAIVDAQFTFNLPPYITACCGFDALGQAIESFWATGADDLSKRYARKAIIKIKGHIIDAVNKSDKYSREELAHGAFLSGKAINISKTTAPHAISYPLTSDFGIPHGHAVALTLGYFFEINENFEDENLAQDRRGADYIRNSMKKLRGILNWSSPAEARKKWFGLMKDCGLGTN
ncbi:uncharacterized protein METZ01_LOCUS443233, partial [marine metagenome]